MYARVARTPLTIAAWLRLRALTTGWTVGCETRRLLSGICRRREIPATSARIARPPSPSCRSDLDRVVVVPTQVPVTGLATGKRFG